MPLTYMNSSKYVPNSTFIQPCRQLTSKSGGAGGVNLVRSEQQYLVSTALIVSGTLSLIQITRFHIYKTPYYVGTGLISVVGISFAIIP